MFLFEDTFMKNICELIPTMEKKIQFFEKCIKTVNVESLDVVRKLAWVLSKLYF